MPSLKARTSPADKSRPEQDGATDARLTNTRQHDPEELFTFSYRSSVALAPLGPRSGKGNTLGFIVTFHLLKKPGEKCEEKEGRRPWLRRSHSALEQMHIRLQTLSFPPISLQMSNSQFPFAWFILFPNEVNDYFLVQGKSFQGHQRPIAFSSIKNEKLLLIEVKPNLLD